MADVMRETRARSGFTVLMQSPSAGNDRFHELNLSPRRDPPALLRSRKSLRGLSLCGLAEGVRKS